MIVTNKNHKYFHRHLAITYLIHVTRIKLIVFVSIYSEMAIRYANAFGCQADAIKWVHLYVHVHSQDWSIFEQSDFTWSEVRIRFFLSYENKDERDVEWHFLDKVLVSSTKKIRFPTWRCCTNEITQHSLMTLSWRFDARFETILKL